MGVGGVNEFGGTSEYEGRAPPIARPIVHHQHHAQRVRLCRRARALRGARIDSEWARGYPRWLRI